MTIRIGINGFGRIGRNVLRAAVQNFPDIEVVGINDLLEPDYLAYMLRYDSVHGRFKGEIGVEGNTLIVGGKKIRLTQERDPANLKWNEIGADIVLESLRKIGGPALATREAALGAVLNVVAKLRSEREVTLRVSARDLEVLEADRGALERAFAGRRFAMVADPLVELGGCIVESSRGSLDGRFETQLQGLIETLRDARSQPEVAR